MTEKEKEKNISICSALWGRQQTWRGGLLQEGSAPGCITNYLTVVFPGDSVC